MSHVSCLWSVVNQQKEVYVLSSKDIKRELSRKVDIVRQPEFVGAYIQPCLPEAAG